MTKLLSSLWSHFPPHCFCLSFFQSSIDPERRSETQENASQKLLSSVHSVTQKKADTHLLSAELSED